MMNKIANSELRIANGGKDQISPFAIRYLLFTALTVCYSLFAIRTPVFADSNPANDSAAFTISVTPNFDRGIEIDTGNVNLDMGTVDMNASTQTVSPATVTILGNITNTELDLSGMITGGWVFDPNQTFTSTGTNQLNVWASFTDVSSVTVPSQGDEYFRVGTSSGAKLISNTPFFGPAAIGIDGSNGLGRFENNVTDMDALLPGTKRHLWIYLRTPPTTSATAQQSIRFTFSVRSGP